LHVARYPLSDSFVEIVGHKTNINTCEPSAIGPQQTVSAFKNRIPNWQPESQGLGQPGETSRGTVPGDAWYSNI
jgi:hypothetical protein